MVARAQSPPGPDARTPAPPPAVRRLAAAAALGAAGMAAQVLLFREALVRAGGDELALGALLATWLAAGGIGALAGRWPRRAPPGASALGAAFLVAAVAGGALAWRAAPAAGGALPGERLGVALFALQALLWNGPAGAVGGWLFARLAERGGARAPLLVACEALGAAVAGGLLALGPVLALLPSGGALDTRHGRFAVVARGGERWLALDGRDAWLLDGGTPREGLAVLHALLLQTPPGGRVLLAADPDFLPAVLAHEPETVDLLLSDRGLERLLRASAGAELAAALADRRVRVQVRGLRAWLRATPAEYRTIWLGAADPERADAARAVSVEGFAAMAERLERDGRIGLRLGQVDGVLGSLGMQRAALLAAGCSEAGLEPVLFPDGSLLAVRAGAQWELEPAALAARAAGRDLAGRRALEAAWRGLLAPGGLELLNLSLREGERAADPLAALLKSDGVRPRTWPAFPPGARHGDRRPRALLSSLRILEQRARGGRPGLLGGLERLGTSGLFALTLLGLALLARVARPDGRRGGTARAFTLASSSLVGAAGLLLVFERHQAHTGAIYADLGWLSGVFLAGFAFGSRGERWARGSRADLAMLAALAAVAAWAALPAPPAAGAALCAGLLGAGAGAALGRSAASGRAGRAWALDLLAAAPGALLAGVALLPVGGWLGALLALVALKAVSLALRALSREPVERPAR